MTHKFEELLDILDDVMNELRLDVLITSTIPVDGPEGFFNREEYEKLVIKYTKIKMEEDEENEENKKSS